MIRVLKKTNKLGNKVGSTKTKNIPEIDEKLKEEARNLNAEIFDYDLNIGQNRNVVIDLPNYKEDGGLYDTVRKSSGESAAEKVKKAAKEGKSLIFHPKNSGTEMLAHELGHLDNEIKGGRIRKAAAKISKNPSILEDNYKAGEGYNDGSRGIKEYLRRVKNSAAIISDEANASISGLKMLKKHGMSNKDLIKSAKNLYNAGKTYWYGTKPYRKVTKKNTIKPKD